MFISLYISISSHTNCRNEKVCRLVGQSILHLSPKLLGGLPLYKHAWLTEDESHRLDPLTFHLPPAVAQSMVVCSLYFGPD